ncbi:MAG: hypothetical protein NZR01_16390 [Bryobacteraceae bacterium]|nr:hypothetical protein [Bryobacteraceae bacterium]
MSEGPGALGELKDNAVKFGNAKLAGALAAEQQGGAQGGNSRPAFCQRTPLRCIDPHRKGKTQLRCGLHFPELAVELA